MACQDFQLALKQAFESFLNKEGDHVANRSCAGIGKMKVTKMLKTKGKPSHSDVSYFQLQGYQEAAFFFWEEGFIRTLPTFVKNKVVDFVVPAW